ncbi:MAG TPA: four helix bundle protein, partial [Vicinamibacterales bacterium]|nr:four helix bundle protein [Vicinamibacterales bacterium]
MGVTRVEELVAFQWAGEFKRELYRLIAESPAARRDFRYRDQLTAAVSGVEANIAEGFARFRPRECQAFFRYAIGSLAESRVRLKDGVDRGYFPDVEFDRADRLHSEHVKRLSSPAPQ